MDNVEKELLALKEQALDATRRADGEFYQHYLDDTVIAIVPQGIFDKSAVVAQMRSPNSSFQSSRIEDTRAIVLTPDSGIVTYKAVYGARTLFVTTTYVKKNGRWKGILYQQTPLA